MRINSSLVLAGAVLATSLTAVKFSPAAGSGLMVRPKASSAVVANPGVMVRSKPSSALKKLIVAPLSQQIVMTAEKFKGQKVGPGQCTDFVSEVLRLCNARGIAYETWTVTENGQVKKIDSFGWGKQMPSATPQAANIIQFESCHFEYNTGNSWGSYAYGSPHHTAIIKSVNGSVLTLLHQNVDGSVDRSQVREQTIDLSWLKSGHYRVYEAIGQ